MKLGRGMWIGDLCGTGVVLVGWSCYMPCCTLRGRAALGTHLVASRRLLHPPVTPHRRVRLHRDTSEPSLGHTYRPSEQWHGRARYLSFARLLCCICLNLKRQVSGRTRCETSTCPGSEECSPLDRSLFSPPWRLPHSMPLLPASHFCFRSGSTPTPLPPPGTHLLVTDTLTASADFVVYHVILESLRGQASDRDKRVVVVDFAGRKGAGHWEAMGKKLVSPVLFCFCFGVRVDAMCCVGIAGTAEAIR